MPASNQPSGKSRVSTTTLVILCGLLLVVCLVVAVISPVVREVQFIERMESRGFTIEEEPRTEFDWGTLNRWNRKATSILDFSRSGKLDSLRPLRNSQSLKTIRLEHIPMSQDQLSELGTLKNLEYFSLGTPLEPASVSLLRHFPNLNILSLPFNAENIDALGRTPLPWRQNPSSIVCMPASVLEGDDLQSLVQVFPNVKNLQINDSFLGNADLTAFADQPFDSITLRNTRADLSGLQGCHVGILNLPENQYESVDLAPLAGSRITSLVLIKNPQLDERVVPTLLAINDLQTLYLWDTAISSQGYARLAEHPSLESISLTAKQWQRLSEAAKAALSSNQIDIDIM